MVKDYHKNKASRKNEMTNCGEDTINEATGSIEPGVKNDEIIVKAESTL